MNLKTANSAEDVN